jgi:UDPglucose 6-dehydrogenase
MKKDGSCDTSIVEGVVRDIDDSVVYRNCSNRVVIIKSTVPPGTTERLNEECKHISVIFNPEFLTEANFIEDFKTQDRIIIGGPRPASTKVRQLFYKAFPNAHIIKTHSTIAEMVKYTTNTFLATKVSFANEMKMICDELKIDYDKVTEYATLDDRLGKSHWSVPGPDGKLGFGGSCFPKDLNALIDLCYEKSIKANTLFGAWETNLEVRPEQDWKELKGRAVTDE